MGAPDGGQDAPAPRPGALRDPDSPTPVQGPAEAQARRHGVPAPVGFAKLYWDRLAGSSLMDLPVETRWLFVCFAAAADGSGYVRCQTPSAAARMVNVPLSAAVKALEQLSAPDPNSTSEAEGGRRLVAVAGGWHVVNHAYFRELRTPSQAAKARRQQRWRERARLRVSTVDEPAPGVHVLVDPKMPKDQIDFVDPVGAVVGRIEGLAAPRVPRGPREGFNEAQRGEYISLVWAAFRKKFGIERDVASSVEFQTICRWIDRSVLLSSALRGIEETTGTVRNLAACERAVMEAHSHRLKAQVE